MEQLSQRKTLEMERGLFLIKYESSESPDCPPKVSIAAEPGSENTVELILPPDAGEAVLWSPGATLVARATQTGRLRVVVAAAEPNGSTAARVQVIALSDDPAGARNGAPATAQFNLSEFRVLGHVAGRGDVVVDTKSWLGGPLVPSRIEGISIQWPDQPRDLTLRYAVTIGGPRSTMGQFVETGAYAGTRGRALPLVGMTLEIAGPAATGQQLIVDSIFLGSPQTTIMGRRVVLAGPTGREPLVGLRLRLESADKPKSARDVGQKAYASLNEPVRNEQIKQDDQIQQDGRPRRFASTRVIERGSKPDRSDMIAPPPNKRPGRVRVFRSVARTELR
jgi:hypothetical protein